MSLLLKNIKFLIGVGSADRLKVSGKDMDVIQIIENAYIHIRRGIIQSIGPMIDLVKNEDAFAASKQIDLESKSVMPCFCDSHTHLVYAASREQEFEMRIRGLSYQQIAEQGGGILNSAKRLSECSAEDLEATAMQRIYEVVQLGTGAIEIKSGYGLSMESELKILHVIRNLKKRSPIPVRATFLGAHAIPEKYAGNKEKYIQLLINEMMPEIARENLADYCDVFCERGYFDAADTTRILHAAKDHGMKPRVHAEQLSHSGGIQAGVAVKAISVDHLEYCSDDDIRSLSDSDTMPTILPGAQFFLSLPYPPVRKMIDAGLPVAIASDYNPGSSPTGNMHLMLSLACINYKMTPSEAIQAATLNSAYALELSDKYGSIAPGKIANLIITRNIPSIAYLPYAFGSNPVDSVLVNGEFFHPPN